MRAHAGPAGDRGYRDDGPRRARSTAGAGVAVNEPLETGVDASEATGPEVGARGATGPGVGCPGVGCSDR